MILPLTYFAFETTRVIVTSVVVAKALHSPVIGDSCPAPVCNAKCLPLYSVYAPISFVRCITTSKHTHTRRSVVCITNRRCHVSTAVHPNGARECVPMIFISQDSTPTPRTNVESNKKREMPLRIRSSSLAVCAERNVVCIMRTAQALQPPWVCREALRHFIFVFLRFSPSTSLRCVALLFSSVVWCDMLVAP